MPAFFFGPAACCWRATLLRIPDGFTQTLTRIPCCKRMRNLDQFKGWFWICPCCRKQARILYCPVDQPDLPTIMNFAPALAHPLPKPSPIFACRHCHGVLHFSRATLDRDWGLLIQHYTGGLLLGREVNKPAFLTPARKRQYQPRSHPKVEARRQRLQQLLLTTGLTRPQLAAELGITLVSLRKEIHLLYKSRNVHTREALRALLHPQPHPPLAAAAYSASALR